MTRKKSEAPTSEPPARYVPTAREQVAVDAFKARRDAAAPLPKLKVTVERGVANISSEHPDEPVAAALQLNALGMASPVAFGALLKNVINLTHKNGQADETEANEMFALVAGLEPSNTVEAMLAVQMAAIHRAAIAAAQRTRAGGDLESAQFNTKALNNLTRTFAAQAETMKKLRGTGEQKVTVEHRHYHLAAGAIAPGSQAVLGDVSGGGVGPKSEQQSHEQDNVLLSERAAMLGAVQANGLPMSGAGADWEIGVSLPRGTRRSALRAA